MNNGAKEVVLNGKLQDYSEYVEIKELINASISENILNIYFINASTIDSNILGYMLKLYEHNKININIVVSNSKLYNFLKDIEFNKFFDIKIKEYE